MVFEQLQAILDIGDVPFLRFWVLSVKKFPKMDKIRVSDVLKKYLQL